MNSYFAKVHRMLRGRDNVSIQVESLDGKKWATLKIPRTNIAIRRGMIIRVDSEQVTFPGILGARSRRDQMTFPITIVSEGGYSDVD